ncbi:MAG: 3-phosphoglycerate dehydrogenase [Microbacter sp.]
MKILVATEKPFAKTATDGIKKISDEAGYTVTFLEEYTDVNDLYKAVADANALIVRSDKVTKEVIDAAKHLQIVVRAGAGYDNIDLQACSDRNIVVMNTPGQNSNAVAELVIGMMIFMARNHFQPGTGTELKGKKIGLHAYGNVGKLVAPLAKSFGMEVYAFDPYIAPEIIEKDGVIPVKNVEELFSTCQYVSLHIPATPETKQSINYHLISKMPKNACLINTARKEVMNEADLFKIMNDRPDIKYITDIMPDMHADLINQFGTRYFSTAKKIGAETAEANINAGLAAAKQIIRFFQHGDKTFQVNK